MLTRSLRRSPPSSLRKNIQFNFSENNGESITEWMKKVSSKVSTGEGKQTVGQLNALMSFYNKSPVSVPEKINWEKYNSEISTPDLVNNLRNNFENLLSKNYERESILDHVKNSSSDAYTNMNNELQFHNDLWYEYHVENKMQENELNEVGNLLDYDLYTLVNMDRKLLAKTTKLVETKNILPGTHDDVNYYGYLQTQFAWGRKQLSANEQSLDDCALSRG